MEQNTIYKLYYLIAGILILISNSSYSFENETFSVHGRDIPSPEMMMEMNKYDVKFYHIDLDVTNTTTYLTGSTAINLVSKENGLSIILLQLSTRLEVTCINANNQEARFVHRNDILKITLPEPLMAGDPASIVINYSGQPDKGEGIKSSKDHKWSQTILWTMSESSNAYKWFPVKQDLTDKADSAYIFITVPENLKAVSNGVLKNVIDAGNNKMRYEWVTRYPIAYYLISIVVGDYSEYNLADSIDGKSISLPNYVYSNPECLPFYKNTIDYTPFLMELFSYLFIPYPFAEEKYGQVMAPFRGGMEHQTITLLGFYSFGLMAHEMSHQWFGDYVTCSTWQDIWINEGFASYCEYLAYELATQPEIAKRWLDSAKKLAMQNPRSSIYLNLNEVKNESRIFNYNLSYMKGALIIHMLRKEIDNDALFFNVLREFLDQFKNGTASGNDFLNVLNRVTSNDYSWFFDQWYYGKGHPKVFCKYNQKDNSVIIKLNQETTSSETPFFRMSIDVRLNNESGYSDTTLVWDANNQVFKLFSNDIISSLELDPSEELLALQKSTEVDKSLTDK
jgi:aminopeptidase N